MRRQNCNKQAILKWKPLYKAWTITAIISQRKKKREKTQKRINDNTSFKHLEFKLEDATSVVQHVYKSKMTAINWETMNLTNNKSTVWAAQMLRIIIIALKGITKIFVANKRSAVQPLGERNGRRHLIGRN